MMAATKQRQYDYGRMSMSDLRDHAKQTHPEHTDDAARAYVDRLIDLELERRLDLLHRRPGWHAHSPVAMIGCGGGGGGRHDQMLVAYEKGIPNSYWHEVARVVLGKLPTRRLMALMIKAAKMDSRLEGPWCATFDQVAAALGSYAQMLGWPGACVDAAQTVVSVVETEVPRSHRNSQHVFPMRPDDTERELARIEAAKEPRRERRETKERKPMFKDGQAIKDAAKNARIEAILMAKAGIA